ncbi:glycosyl hydrolase family 38 [Micromonospora violae]|uniref:Glycosyl hydrolase family 38 n=1 Tax=Micromonospora violae TaxID=1278207 RepID=A0A4Q7UFC8_9ACTN|nr:hypothetical protein [Micromonospora violae]RZT79008.1 glycosyl hydrolase family 38 [Micromonospora violae]
MAAPTTELTATLAVPGVDLPAFQPGPLNAGTGWQPHRVEVPLRVPDAVPTAGWVLRLEFAAGHGPCPDLEIEVDGAYRGLFHPRVRRADRSETYRHGPIAGDVTLDVRLPAAWLGPGEHTIAITTTMDVAAATGPVPAEPADAPRRHREQFGNHFGSGITWHRLTLRPAHGPEPAGPTAQLVATPLFLHAERGLRELLELTVSVPARSGWPRQAEVRIGTERHLVDLHRPGRQFGDVRVRFPVPEPAVGTVAEVSLDGGTPTTVELRPPRKWTLHLIPHVHLDVGYTDVQGKVLELHSRNLDRALDQLDRDPGFAFSVDGSLVVAEYLATRSPERAERLLAALRSGRLAVNAFHSLFLSGVASLEETYRAAYLAARLRDEHGVPVGYANLTDVPSYSSALPSMLSALGVSAFVGIENHHRGGNADSDEQHMVSPVMWEGVGGERILAHFSDTYSQLRFMVGDPQTLAGGAHAFPRLLARYERSDYLPDDLAVIGTHADNEDLADGDAGFADRWNAVYAYPRIRVSTMADYLDAVRPLADRLPVWRGDGGSYWEDGVGTGATVTAEHRRVQSALPAAEGIAAMVTLADPRYRVRREALDAAWDGALFGCEHTWTWAHGTAHPHGEQVHDQLDWKRHQVHTALRTALDETRRALSQLGELVHTRGPTLLVHNPLGWQRDVEVEAEALASAPFLLDGEPLPAEVLADCNGLRTLRLTVPDVPAFGYRALPVGAARTLAPGAEDGTATSAAGAADGGWAPVPAHLETARWLITLDPTTGAVTGLRHRPTGRELLDLSAPWRLGEVLYVRNGPDSLTRGDHLEHTSVPHTHPPAPRSTLLGRRLGPGPDGQVEVDPPELTVTRARVRPVGVRRTYDGWRLRTVGSAPSLPRVEVDILLRDGTDRVDVLVRLEKQRVLAKESVYVAFPFAGEQPSVRYDRQQGWVDPATDHAPGACHDWFTTQYGVVVEATPGGPAVAWTSVDAPLFTVGDVVRGAWAPHFAPASALFSWVLNNYWPTNTPPEQDGTLTLRYAFTPLSGFDPVAAGRFGREVRAAPAVSEVTRLDKFDTDHRPLSATAGTLLDLDLPDWVHATVGTARGGGLLLRLQDLAGRAGRLRLRHPAGSTGNAVLCHADEREITRLTPDQDGRLTVELTPWQVVSLVLHVPHSTATQ